ncbi:MULTISPECIES: LuxR C-terminal-related transcriptional regulator [unclassified Streptomyces]|uniref:LuxR C-terminal-related transcriptional regulator n=2 Tax=Streptomyces TaxID=1883 RepID=UPI001F0ED557|nr:MULTISPECIES: LuxR C-terminal-related transcriptional regulator [unclassified Streptomyces]
MGGSAPRRDCRLPVETTSFVDRRAELAEGRELLARARLVTLTGPGGVGKTRLAGRIAARVARAFPDGVRVVHLSGLHDPALVPVAAADALDLHDHSAQPPLEALVAQVRERRLLLVVDNCEHLPTACAELAAALLHGTTGVRVLATSRHRLGLTEEHLLEVRPLPVPDPDGDLSAAEPGPALALFADRAAAVVPGFRLTPANRPAVARLCRRLDGLPLAIELAAVRMRVLSVEQLLERLDDRYRLLSAGSPSVLPRHQTLRAAVDWSHDLCTEREQLMWARLSVLAGSFDLETAEAVCADGARVRSYDVLEAVAGLVDKSVLCREPGPDGVRYRLLDTLRHYGLERLRQHPGEELAARRRQRDWMQQRAAACERAWFGPGQREIVARLRADQDNLRAALAFGLTGADPMPGHALGSAADGAPIPAAGDGPASADALTVPAEAGPASADALGVPVEVRPRPAAEVGPAFVDGLAVSSEVGPASADALGVPGEVRPRPAAEVGPAFVDGLAVSSEVGPASADALAVPADALAVPADVRPTPADALASLRLAGTLWFYWHACGAPREGRYWLDRALDACPEPTPERARALWVAGLLADCPEDLTRGRRRAEEARSLARRLGVEAEAAHAEYVLGVILLFSDDLHAALAHFRACVERGRVPGQHLSLVGLDRVELACALGFLGEADQAIAVCEDARRLCERHGEEWVLSYVHRMLALAHTVKKDRRRAERHAREALRLKLAVNDIVGIGLTLDLLAQIAAQNGAHDRAAVLLGGADRIWADVDRDRWGSAALDTTRRGTETRAREALGAAAYERSYEHGATLGLTGIAGYALDEHPEQQGPEQPTAQRPQPGVRLTRRETQVAELVAEGLANQQIADRLVIARRTAEGHVERILSKLGFSNRSQIAAWITAQR